MQRIVFPNILNIAFIFSLLSMQLSFLVFIFLDTYIPFHFGLYIFFFYIIPIIFFLKKGVILKYDLFILVPIIYISLVLLFISDFNIELIFKGYKQLLPPFIIYFFLRVTLTTLPRIYGFLKVIVYSGVITSFYLLLEIIFTYKSLFPALIYKRYDFLAILNPGLLENQESIIEFYKFANTFMGRLVLRPSGIFFDIHTQGFILLTALLVVLFTGEILRSKEKFVKPILALIFLSIWATTSGTYVVLTLMVLSYIFVRKKYLARITFFIKNRLFYIITSFILLFVITSIAFFDYFSMLGRKLGFTIGGLSGSASFQITTTEFISFVFQFIPTSLYEGSFFILFGTGFSERPALGGEAHFIGEQITYIGIIGFLCYWIPIVRSLFICRRCMRIPSQYRNLFIIGFLLSSCLILTLIHYSPMNICTVFIIGFLLYIGFLGDRLLKGRLNSITTF